MKQLIRAGLTMLAVSLALLVFSFISPDRQEASKASPASPAAVTASPSPVSFTLPPHTSQPLPPTPSPTPPPFTTEQELLEYLAQQLEQAGYKPADETGLASFDSVPENYRKLEGAYMRLDPGTGEDEMYIQYWYCLEPARILSLQQVFSRSAPQGSNNIEYYNLRNFPYFKTDGWVNYRVNYSTDIDGSYLSVLLDSFDRLSSEELEFISHIS